MEIKREIVNQIRSIISNAQSNAIRAVDNERVLMYWQIGKVIFEEEQQGMDRAEYGKFLIKTISETFQPQFGTGFSVRQLELNRQFFRTFPNTNALCSQLNWTHYRTLIRIENRDKIDFYIAETEKNNWTARQLERQINSQLFERLLMSKSLENTDSDFNQILLLIQEAKNRVYAKANKELVLLYFNVGKVVSEKVNMGNWGDKTVQELANFIASKQPELTGFNRRGLYRMKSSMRKTSHSGMIIIARFHPVKPGQVLTIKIQL